MEEYSLTTLPNGWTVGRFAVLDEIGWLAHAVTTKQSLDVQLVRNDHAAAAGQLAVALGLEQVAFANQVHGGVVLDVKDVSGRDRRDACPTCCGDADGLVATDAGVGLMTRGADCPLILAVDPAVRVIGTAHASWRGTVCRIAEELVRQMQSKGAAAERIIACICPSAGPCCYEVGPDVLDEMTARVGPHVKQSFIVRSSAASPEKRGQARIGEKIEGRTILDGAKQVQTSPRNPSTVNSSQSPFFLDLWSANRDQLVRAGLRENNVHVSGVCTMCHTEMYPSHRREGAAAGRLAAVIGRVQ